MPADRERQPPSEQNEISIVYRYAGNLEVSGAWDYWPDEVESVSPEPDEKTVE